MDDKTFAMAPDSTQHLPSQGMPDGTLIAGQQTQRLSAPSPADSTLLPGNTPEEISQTPVASETQQSFVIKGAHYKCEKILSDTSGEAQVFLVSRHDKQYALKLYYPGFEINNNLMKVVRNLDFELIVKVIDFGRTFIDSQKRSYELMEYIEGGTMHDLKLEGQINKFRRYALQAAAALHYLHHNNILHKDIKPSNFFFRDDSQEMIVLGDFGISSLMEKGSESIRTTQARTPVYAAPEMYSDVIDGEVELTPAADFYSLGITLFTLWLGENPMSNNERTMMKQKNEGRLPKLDMLPDTVKVIIQGLTAINPYGRWGYEQVERWFKGEKVPVDLSSAFLRYKSFVVDPERNLVANNVKELVPMLVDNPLLGTNYIYNGTIAQWLEQCGNSKLSTMVNDIITNIYPQDKQAGLMLAAYIMEPNYPYYDLDHQPIDDIHSLALTLLSHIDRYSVTLQKPNDNLFLWLEAHSNCNIDRLRSYFLDKQAEERRNAVLRMVYEIAPDIPFIPGKKINTIPDIVSFFASQEPTPDNWQSLCDGRLLSWMYSHADETASESLRLLTDGKPFSKQLAYKVLYNMHPSAGYDLKEANTPERIGKLIARRLIDTQKMPADEFENHIADVADKDGALAFYCKLHGWNNIVAQAERCFDLDSQENQERLGTYDLKTATYRFCRILGCTPYYQLPDGTKLINGQAIPSGHNKEIQREIREGSFLQWLAVFYHEDPTRDFSEPYAYERELEGWTLEIGSFDKSHNFYRRYVSAREETVERTEEVRKMWLHSKMRGQSWKYAFYATCAIWVALVLLFGVSGRDYLLGHWFASITLPLGGMTGVIVGTRAYFKGYGPMLSVLFGCIGAATTAIPILLLTYVNSVAPAIFNLTIVIITAVYMAACHLTDFRTDSKADADMIRQVLDDDINSTLIEPLQFAYKARSYKFKGSKFNMLDEVKDLINSLSGEAVIHYMLWTLLAVVMVAEFVVFNHKLLDIPNPDLGANSVGLIEQTTPQNTTTDDLPKLP